MNGFTQLHNAIQHRKGQYPFLEAAEYDRAFSTKVEWLFEAGDGHLFAEFNYCQIFRGQSVDQILTMIETQMEFGGAPIYDPGSARPFSSAGSVRHYVPSGPVYIELKVLRDLELLPEHGRHFEDEYVCELSWLVTKV